MHLLFGHLLNFLQSVDSSSFFRYSLHGCGLLVCLYFLDGKYQTTCEAMTSIATNFRKPPAATGENGRAAGKARPILLAAVDGEPSDTPAFRVDGTADRVVAPA